MKKLLIVSIILFTLIITTGCNNIEEEIDYSFLDNPEIKLETKQNNNHTVSFFIETNIPLPIEVMA
jgi:hypothetical protein